MVKCFVSFFYAHPLTLLTPIYICVQGEEFGTTSDVHSLIVNWESRMEVEERSMNAPQKEDTEGRGGWRKSQIFLDLCSKFENKNREEEMEVEDKSVRVVHRCENPPSFGGAREKLQNSDNYTFSSLRASWDTHVPRKSNWKQQKINSAHNGFSLVSRPADQKRGGSEDKVSAGKRLKQC